MKDKIDERNKKEKMQKSVVKYWNVRYTPAGQSEQCQEKKAAEEETREEREKRELAEALLRRQEEKRRHVVEEAIEEDAAERQKIEQILHEKSDKLHDLIEHHGHRS